MKRAGLFIGRRAFLSIVLAMAVTLGGGSGARAQSRQTSKATEDARSKTTHQNPAPSPDKVQEGPGETQAEPPVRPRKEPWTVLIALPGGILPGENAEVRRAVDIYLRDFRVEVEEIGPLPGGMRAQVARTREVAQSRSLRLAVVLYWSAEPTTRELTATFVDLLRPSAAPLVFTVSWPHQPDSAFYRNLGLKLRSTLLSMVGAPPEPPKKGGGKGTFWEGGSSGLRFGIEAWAALGVALVSENPVPSFGGSLSLHLGRFSVGPLATYTLEERRTFDAAEGDTAVTRLAMVVGWRLTSPYWRFGLFAELQGGALHLRTTARERATGIAYDRGQWIPVVSIAIPVGYDIGRHVRMTLGPRLDVFPVQGWLTFLGTRVYDTGRLQPWADLRVLFFF